MSMERKKIVELPFRIDPKSRTDIFGQLVGALRQAIETGAYKAGEVLPTMQELAEATGVSFGTSRRVIERLTDEGYVNPRPRVGSVVMPRKTKLWKGHVLFIYPADDDTSWYTQTFSSALRSALVDSGYLYTPVPAPRKRAGDFAQLEAMLRMPFDFALVMYDSPGTVAHLRKAKLPYAGVCWSQSGDDPKTHNVQGDGGPAKEAFAAHCRRAGIRSVWDVASDAPGAFWRADVLASADLNVRRIAVRRAPSSAGVNGLELGALRLFVKEPLDALPDLIVFNDDVLAQGALTALLARGVRIPEDVKVVTLANRGAGPVFVKPLTRFEVDAQEDARTVARYVSGVLTSRQEPPVPVLCMKYVIGETFPE